MTLAELIAEVTILRAVDTARASFLDLLLRKRCGVLNLDDGMNEPSEELFELFGMTNPMKETPTK